MDITSITKYARISPTKARDFIRCLRGLPVAEALNVINFSKRKAAFLIGKTLKSAIAGAGDKADLSVDNFVVKEAVIDDGPRMKRSWPRARGSASPIKKKMSHIKIVLSDGKDVTE